MKNWSKSALLCLTLSSAVFVASEVGAQQPPAPPPDGGQPSSEVLLSDQERQACIDSFSKAQTHRMLGDLRAARTTVQGCTVTKCGRLAPECAAMERQLADDIPTLIVRVRDHQGNDVADAQVVIGGRVVDFSAGLAVEMNPGNYLMVVQRPGTDPINQTVVLGVREKNREIVATFPPPKEEPPAAAAVAPAPGTGASTGSLFGSAAAPPADTQAPESKGVSALVPVGFAIAGAGLIVFAVAGGISLDRQSALEDKCPDDQCPSDAQDDVDAAKASARAATAGLIGTGLGLGLGLVGLLISDFSKDEPAKDGGGEIKASLELTPLIGPGYLGLSGRF